MNPGFYPALSSPCLTRRVWIMFKYWGHTARDRILRCPLDAYSPRITLFSLHVVQGLYGGLRITGKHARIPIVHWIHIISTVPRNRMSYCLQGTEYSTLYTELSVMPLCRVRRMVEWCITTDLSLTISSQQGICVSVTCVMPLSVNRDVCMDMYPMGFVRVVNVSDSSHAISLPVLCTAYSVYAAPYMMQGAQKSPANKLLDSIVIPRSSINVRSNRRKSIRPFCYDKTSQDMVWDLCQYMEHMYTLYIGCPCTI